MKGHLSTKGGIDVKSVTVKDEYLKELAALLVECAKRGRVAVTFFENKRAGR